MRLWLSFIVFLLSNRAYTQGGEPSDSQSRSIKTSLNKVLRDVKSKLEFLFSSKQEQNNPFRARLKKKPLETILPEAWLQDDRNFLLPDIPTDIELQIDDLNRRWEKENRIVDIDQKKILPPRNTRYRKKQKLKTKYENKEDEDKTESKIYFTQIIRKRPTMDPPVKEKKKALNKNPSNKKSSSKKHAQTDLLDKYSPFIYAELLKENETSFAVVENLTVDSGSVVINRVNVNGEPLEMTENIDYEEEDVIDNDMVTLEVAMVDTIAYKSNTSETISSGFLPFIPAGGIDFEYEVAPEEEDSDNSTEVSEDMITLTTDSDPFRVSLKPSNWSFSVMVGSASLLFLLMCYECSVIFSFLPPLSTTSHSLVLGLLLSLLSSLLLTTQPTPLICAATRLLTPLSYTIIFSSLLVKFIFLTFLSSQLFLSTSYQVVSLLVLTSVQVFVSSYLLIRHSPDLVFSSDTQTVLCSASFQQRLHCHLYNILLLAATVILYLVYQEVRQDFIEAKYIGVSSLLSGPILVSWVVAGLIVQTEHQDLTTILGLLLTSAVSGLSLLLLVRLHREDSGYRDGYKQARKLRYFSVFPTKLEHAQLFFSIFGIRRQNVRDYSEGNLMQENFKSIDDLTKVAAASSLSGWDSDGTEMTQNSESHKPYAGYRRTDSFDRFPFMSRPPKSGTRPGSAVPSTPGVQSQTNPNVLFCTPSDIRRATLSRF